VKKRALIILLFLVVILITSVSCSVIEGWLNPNQPVEVEIEVSDIKMEDFNLMGGTATFDVTLKSKNSSKLTITGYDFSLNFKDDFSFVTPSQKTNIKVEDNFHTMTLTQEIIYSEMAKDIPDIEQYSQLEVEIEGRLYVESRSEGKNISFSKTSMLPVAQNPEITGNDVEVLKLEYTYAVLGFEVVIENNNAFDVTYTPNYSILVENFEIAAVSNANKITAEANSTTTHVIERQIRLLSLSEQVLRKDSANVSLKGIFQYESSLGTMEQDVAVYGTFDPPALPKIEADDISIKTTAAPPSATLNLVLEVDNPNTFEVVIKSWDFNITLNQVTLVDSYQPDSIELPSKKKTKVTLPIEIDPTVLANTGLTGDYMLNIEAVIESLSGGDDLSVNYEVGFF
jgi:LEA14-like dessication related protein